MHQFNSLTAKITHLETKWMQQKALSVIIFILRLALYQKKLQEVNGNSSSQEEIKQVEVSTTTITNTLILFFISWSTEK